MTVAPMERGLEMTAYRMACVMLVGSTLCLALAWGMRAPFHIIVSSLCVFLAGQFYASVVKDTARRYR
jgi:hypothetical protein